MSPNTTPRAASAKPAARLVPAGRIATVVLMSPRTTPPLLRDDCARRTRGVNVKLRRGLHQTVMIFRTASLRVAHHLEVRAPHERAGHPRSERLDLDPAAQLDGAVGRQAEEVGGADGEAGKHQEQ